MQTAEAPSTPKTAPEKSIFREIGHGRKSYFISPLIIRIDPGDKLLWQKNHQDFGFDLNRVDASVQEK